MPSREIASWSELFQGRNGLRSVVLAGGVGLHAINVYIVATILPSVVQDIGGLEYYAWNTTLFVVASIFGSALSPKALDAYGPRLAYLTAILIFALGTAVCATAPSMRWLLVGRTAQGFGGGILLGLSYASIRIVFEDRLWPRAMALVSSMWGVATLLGPAIGGIFAQTGHWRLAFWVVLPIAAVLAWLVNTQLDRGAKPSATSRIKAPFGKITALAASVLVISLGSLSESLAWNAVGVVIGLGIGIGVAQADKRAVTKLMPAGAYSIKTHIGSLYACLSLLSVGVTTEIFVAYFLQTIHGHTPLVAGYMTALMAAGWTTGSIISSGRTHATANRLIRIGPVLSALSLLALAVLMPWASLTQANGGSWWLVVPLLGVGMGIGLCWPRMSTQVFKAAPVGQENIAASAITTLQLYSMAMGSTLAGVVANAAGFTHPGGMIGAQQAAIALFAIFACAPGMAALLTGRVVRQG
ncbi:MAG: MFS transporter [Paralcaligenes sp.]